MKIDFNNVLPMFMPSVQWTLPGSGTDRERYDNLEILDGTEKPTFEQIEQWQLEYESYQSSTEYQRLRKSEYPSIEDMVPALWERVVEGRPEYSDSLEEERQAIKAKYPKP